MKRRIYRIGWLIGCVVSGIILINSLAYALPPGMFKPGSEPDGFRGIRWEQDISTVEGLVYVNTDPSYGGVELYRRKGDELRIGAAKLEDILYGFWQNKFCVVKILVKGSVNWAGLKQAAFEKFGEGFQSNKYIEKYVWLGENTLMLLKYNEILEKGDLLMASKKITEQQKEWEKQKAKEGAKEGW